jgi:hypothetical protein
MGEMRRYSSGSSYQVGPKLRRNPLAMSAAVSSRIMSLTARSEQAATNRSVWATTHVVMYPP